jgi:hypothetical protein
MSEASVPVTIYHNPTCGTSRNTLGLIRNAGILNLPSSNT